MTDSEASVPGVIQPVNNAIALAKLLREYGLANMDGLDGEASRDLQLDLANWLDAKGVRAPGA